MARAGSPGPVLSAPCCYKGGSSQACAVPPLSLQSLVLQTGQGMEKFHDTAIRISLGKKLQVSGGGKVWHLWSPSALPSLFLRCQYCSLLSPCSSVPDTSHGASQGTDRTALSIARPPHSFFRLQIVVGALFSFHRWLRGW